MKLTYLIRHYTSLSLLLLASVSQAQTIVPGNIDAEFSVNAGIASYSIPIKVASGRAGMQPDLSINYASGGSNGILGRGWSLGGISAIHRCAATIAQDGFRASVNFSDTDRYCLNGQRLVAIDGANGGVGTEYRTEVDSYSQIMAVGGSVNNPDHWVVKTKSGQVITYGDGNYSALTFNQGVHTWNVSDINDTTGNNAIEFGYFIDGNIQYPDTITYPGGRVELEYEDRSDTPKAYVAGNELQRRYRISSINSFSSNVALYSLRMEYESDINHSYLSSIQKCADSNTTCLNPIAFDREPSANTLNDFSLWMASGLGPHTYNYVEGSNSHGVYSALIDINGDGLPDRVGHHNYQTNTGGLHVALNTGNGFGPFELWYASGQGPHTYNYVRGTNGSGTYSDLIDMNGDGLLDRVGHYNYQTNTKGIHVALNTGSGFGAFELWLPSGRGPHTDNYLQGRNGHGIYSDLIDMNGDGLPDRVGHHNYQTNTGGLHVALNTGSGFGPFELWYASGQGPHTYNYVRGSNGNGIYSDLVDMNGDGLPDRVGHHNYQTNTRGLHVALNTGSGFGPFELWLPHGQGPHTENYVQGYNGHGVFSDLMDMNGDGLPDRVGHHNYQTNTGGLHVALNTGNGFAPFELWYASGQGPHTYNYVRGNNGHGTYSDLMDMNGDGLPDRVGHHNYQTNTGGLHVALNTGKGFGDFELWFASGQGPHTYNYIQGRNEHGLYSDLLDINGDGFLDRVGHHNYQNSTGGIHASLSQVSHQFVDEITDSFGNATQLAYKPLTDKTVYTKGSDAVYPLMDLQHAQYVVSRVDSADGVGGFTTMSYQYEGLKTHLLGRGSYGYSNITERYTDTGKLFETVYSQSDFTAVGQVLSATERYNGNKINEAHNTYQSVETNTGVFQLYLQESIQRSYELGNDSIPVTSIITTNANIDEYGNVGRVNVTTSGGADTFTKITQSHYDNDTSNWLLGRLRTSSVTHQSPYADDETRYSSFTYDSVTGLLSSESMDYANGSALKETHYRYNQYGQQIEVRESTPVAGYDDRVTTTIYTSDTASRVAQTCNALNQCERSTYTAEGWLRTLRGPNNLTTRYHYDHFGRRTREDRADGSWTTIEHRFAQQNQCGQAARLISHCTLTQSNGRPPEIVQYDHFGRDIRKIKTGFDGRLIFSDTEYNALAQIDRISRDYYEGDQIYWATSEYDVLGRVIRVTEPGPNASRTEVVTEYNGLTTSVVSGPDEKTVMTTTNVLGQKVLVEEEEGAYSEHTYNSDGQLLTSTISGDRSTTITFIYDEFGRKIAMSDPDMGSWQYSYTPFGELRTQRDAKNQVVTMTYDLLGRLVNRVESEGTSTWEYYDNTAPLGSIGQLYRESSNGITKTHTYDRYGRADSTTTNIGANSFVTETEYDNLGRVSRLHYPGAQAFFTENTYNEQGYLKSVRGPRNQSESHNYSALQPLIAQSLASAENYLQKAQQLRDLGNYYQSQITYYESLTGTGCISDALNQQLKQHEHVLNQSIGDGQSLSPEFLGHLNNKVIELYYVRSLIYSQEQEYQNFADQLVVLAEQTLAASDHTFQIERTITRTAGAYGDLLDDTSYITYWRAVDVDASGRISAEVYGNGIVNDYAYNQATGQLQSIHSSLLTVDALRHIEYQYDAYQNVTLRHDLVNDIRETYAYDRLDRLISSDVVSTQYNSNHFNHTQSVDYDVLGNITHKSDVGAYRYGQQAGPHAVTRAGNIDYRYDANGNMISGNGRTIQWSSFNKALQITKDGRSVNFAYGPDRARYQKINHQGDTTLYIGKLYEQLTKSSGSTEEKYYIYAAGELVAEHIVSSENGTQTLYLHKDALDSVDLITDAQANVVDRRSFDAWGKMRDLPWKANASLDNPIYLTQLPFTNKGYTGHEHVQEVGLINMNGRMYDAMLGRFISADPHLQEPSMSQSFNRYSYVLNNPMKYNDPSGYFFKKLFKGIKKVFKGIAKAVKNVFKAIKPYVGIIVGGLITAFCQVCGPIVAGMVAGAVGSAVNGGNILQGALMGGLSGAVFGFIGGLDISPVARTIAHGIAGGTLSVIQGGKFGVGFLSAGFAKFATLTLSTAGVFNMANRSFGAIMGRTAIAAVVGGTASVIGGGKFANGAKAAAFAHLFNAEWEHFVRGKLAHRLLQEYLQNRDPGQWQSEVHVRSGVNPSGAGRLDILHSGTNGAFEIKPNNPAGIASGTAQLTDYIAANPGLTPGNNALVFGPYTSIRLYGMSGLTNYEFVYTSGPTPGLIVYDHRAHMHVMDFVLEMIPLRRLFPGRGGSRQPQGQPVPAF